MCSVHVCFTGLQFPTIYGLNLSVSLSLPLSLSSPQVWLQYQSLWDMESGNIYGRLDTDLARWQKLLMDVKYVFIYSFSKIL